MPKALPVIDTTAPVCCAPVAAGPMSDHDALQIALRLKALADPARVKIVSHLFSSDSGEEISGNLAAVLGLSESTASKPPGLGCGEYFDHSRVQNFEGDAVGFQ